MQDTDIVYSMVGQKWTYEMSSWWKREWEIRKVASFATFVATVLGRRLWSRNKPLSIKSVTFRQAWIKWLLALSLGWIESRHSEMTMTLRALYGPNSMVVSIRNSHVISTRLVVISSLAWFGCFFAFPFISFLRSVLPVFVERSHWTIKRPCRRRSSSLHCSFQIIRD